jgi:vancomycin aglycone glucosyltransferase
MPASRRSTSVWAACGRPQDLGQALVQAARALGRRAIVSRGWAELSVVGDEPDCLAVGEVNVQKLFGRGAAVVHHGGAGTTTVAALAGAPQVVVSQIYDQHYWARRVEELGIGAAHAPGTPGAESLASALERALRPEVAERARSVAARVQTDGARVAAERVSALRGRNAARTRGTESLPRTD